MAKKIRDLTTDIEAAADDDMFVVAKALPAVTRKTTRAALRASIGGAPTDAIYVVGAASGSLSAELVLGTSIIMKGTLASRPAASLAGRLYYVTDTGSQRWTRDTGSAWENVVSQVFNIDLEDLDYIIKGDNDSALLVTDASTDRVGVGVLVPLTKFHVNGGNTAASGEVGSILITGGTNERLGFGYNATLGYAWVQATFTGVSPVPFFLNPNGGGLYCTVHNVAAGAGAQQAISSGTYTPILTGVANVSTSTARVAQWSRVGSVVSASGEMDVDPTAISTLTQVGISLPISSNFASAFQCSGGATMDPGSIAMVLGRINGDVTNDRAQLDYYCDAGAGNRTISWWLQYVIV